MLEIVSKSIPTQITTPPADFLLMPCSIDRPTLPGVTARSTVDCHCRQLFRPELGNARSPDFGNPAPAAALGRRTQRGSASPALLRSSQPFEFSAVPGLLRRSNNPSLEPAVYRGSAGYTRQQILCVDRQWPAPDRASSRIDDGLSSLHSAHTIIEKPSDPASTTRLGSTFQSAKRLVELEKRANSA